MLVRQSWYDGLSMEQHLCVLLAFCALLVAGPCDGYIRRDQAPRTRHIISESSISATGQTEIELDPFAKRINSANEKNLAVESLINGKNKSATSESSLKNLNLRVRRTTSNTTKNEKLLYPNTETGVHVSNVTESVVNTSNKQNTDSKTSEANETVDDNITAEGYADNINSTMACNISFSVIITKWHMFGNGSLLSLDDGTLYPPEYFWKEFSENNITEVRGCLCLLTSCVRKCCPENQTTTEDGMCVASNSSLLYPFSPQFVDEDVNSTVKDLDIHTLYGNPCEYGSFRLDPVRDGGDEFFLLRSGVLSVPDLGNFTVADYCIEAFEGPNEILPLICFPPEDTPEEDSDADIYMMYPIGLIISVPFLFATFLVYAVIPELRNLHGKSLMCHVSSLFTAYAFLVVVQLGSSHLSTEFCIFCAFAIFFAFHATFFWLNVMCFDIWWTFSGLRPLRGSVKEREYKKFVMYSFYAWGSPFVMLVVCVFMDLVPGVPSSVIKPEFGVEKCWFRTETAVLAYFFGPIGVLVLINIILFITTSFKIIGLKRETRMLKGHDSKRHTDEANRQRFNLYLKLFIVMGVNWGMEVISWAVGGPKYLWYITDLGNTLQGLLIFVIFVWTQKVRRLLARRLRPKSASSPRTRFESSTNSQQTPSYTSSFNYTNRTSLTTDEPFHMKPILAFRDSKEP